MESKYRQQLEEIGDTLEGIARVQADWKDHDPNSDARRLFSLAWDIKQIARKGTASEGL